MFTKGIISKGNYSPICSTLSYDKAAYLMDTLEIDKLKYIELRRTLLSKGFKLPAYNSLVIHRASICFVNNIHLVKRDYPIGVAQCWLPKKHFCVKHMYKTCVKRLYFWHLLFQNSFFSKICLFSIIF